MQLTSWLKPAQRKVRQRALQHQHCIWASYHTTNHCHCSSSRTTSEVSGNPVFQQKCQNQRNRWKSEQNQHKNSTGVDLGVWRPTPSPFPSSPSPFPSPCRHRPRPSAPTSPSPLPCPAPRRRGPHPFPLSPSSPSPFPSPRRRRLRLKLCPRRTDALPLTVWASSFFVSLPGTCPASLELHLQCSCSSCCQELCRASAVIDGETLHPH